MPQADIVKRCWPSTSPRPRADSRYRHIPIRIMSSATAMPNTRRGLGEHRDGVINCIQTPLTRESLIQKLEAWGLLLKSVA